VACVGPQRHKKKYLHHKYTDSIIFVIHACEEQEVLRKRGESRHMGQKIHYLQSGVCRSRTWKNAIKSATIATYACLRVNLCLPNFWAVPVPESEILRYVVHLNSE
jgi:hypothetical protein